MNRWWSLLLVVVFGAASIAAESEWGWSEGQVAVGAQRVLGAPPERTVVELPATATDHIDGPTLIVYFSPTCPHCLAVAHELQGLSERIAGKAIVLGVASSGTTETALAEFRRAYGINFEIVVDADRAIGGAMGARSTPSALLVRPEGDELVLADLWYPYLPGYDTLVQMRLEVNPWLVFKPGQYQGTNACAACHTHESDSWRLSHHSIAWHTLVDDEKHTDPACVSCHVTGAGQIGGWTEGNELLVDVGCEACHGPGGPHDGVVTVPRETCAGCHDEKHSINFTYEKGLPLLDHFRSVSLDAEAWMLARKELYEGNAPRSLLAFEPGPTAGSQACATCHQPEFDQWSGSPHGHAMDVLVASNAESDAACVRCHATEKVVSGLPSTDPVAFRTAEGVGCESCHGPGSRHIEAGGGTDNIIGLGESCPVCVIESVCTSCHNARWDPDWDLDRDLPLAGHADHAPMEPETSGEKAKKKKR